MILAPGVDENARHQEAAHRLTQCKKANPNSAFEAKNCATVTSLPKLLYAFDRNEESEWSTSGRAHHFARPMLDGAEVRVVTDVPASLCNQHPVDIPKVTIAACAAPIGIVKEPSFGVSTSHPTVPVGDPSVLVSKV
jgi:hypothetical protein